VGENEEQSIRDYPHEKGIRTRLERLLELGVNDPALQATKARIATLDQQLKEQWQGDSTGGYWWENGSPRLRDDN
jgi:hypothetical protein